MKKIIISLVALLGVLNSYSQNDDIAYAHVAPMTPNAAELAKYSDFPVSYYTGTPNISIPLYQVEIDELKLPISLNYHASGIKVDQEATWVGLGWSLNVGSTISRTVKSVDDFRMGWDRNYPYCQNGYYDAPDISPNRDNHYELSGIEECEPGWVHLNYNLINDPEPDIFYYNLPNMNGKFILDKSRGAVLFDKSHNLKIEIIRTPGNRMVAFKIIDSEGNQYLYDQWEVTQNYTSNGWLNKNLNTPNTIYDDHYSDYTQWSQFRLPDCSYHWDASAMSPYPMVTSWYLSKITTKHGREVAFTYATENQFMPTQESCEKYHYNGQSSLFYNKSKIVNKGLRLNTIEGDFGRIEFNCSAREDIKGTSEKLDLISIYNSTNKRIKSFKFDYDYFNDDYSGDYQYKHVFKRLKLNKLTERSANNPLNNGYDFDYYGGSFPPKNSKNTDYWGFQNGRSYGEDYYIGLRVNGSTTFKGVKKDAEFDKAIIGTLKKITYPAGGTAEFKFESNIFSSSFLEHNTYTEEHGETTLELVNLPVFNNYVSDDFFYSEYPSQRLYNFEVAYETTIKIDGYLENVMGTRDMTYSYDSHSNPIAQLRQVGSTGNAIHTFICPFLWDYTSQQPLGIGGEHTYGQYEFTLQPGSYQFEAYVPPRDVYASWQLRIDTYVPPAPGNPLGPYEGGGIRIKEIKTDATTRKFKYPTGLMLVQPVISYIGRRSAGGIPDHIGDCLVQVSESKSPLSTFGNGNVIGYSWVEEYSGYDENDDFSKIKYMFQNDTESEYFDDYYPDSPRYINYTNGLTQSVEKYKTDGNNSNLILVEKDDFFYTSTSSDFIKAFRDRGQKRNDIISYYYEIEWPLKTKHIKTQIKDDGANLITETNYSYNSSDLMASTMSTSSNSETIKQKVKYPFDFINDPVSIAMVHKNMIGTPIETTIVKDNIVVQGSKILYAEESGIYLPQTILSAEFDSHVNEQSFETDSQQFYKTAINLKYYASGNVKEANKTDGVHVSYIWGYNDQYPLAKIENVTFLQLQSAMAELNQTYNTLEKIQGISDVDNDRTVDIVSPSGSITKVGKEGDLREALRDLRNNLPNSMVTTYTYDPLIGVTSITDPKGQTIYYEYDSFNRLKQIKDAEGNILSENGYNYKQ